MEIDLFRKPIIFKCPNCGCSFSGSRIVSWSTFDFDITYYTDGSWYAEDMPDEHFVCECPKCNRYFLIRDMKRINVVIKKCVECLASTVGSYDDYTIKALEIERWEDVIKKGLFFPEYYDAKEKYKIKAMVYVRLWRAYNRCRDEIDNDKYINVCKKIIEMIELTNDEMCLLKGEVYRNVGEFDECLEILSIIKDRKRYIKHISAIEKACENKVTKVLEV